MGSFDIIPGISGGTIAFITGIYHDLIKSIDRFSFKKLLTGKFKTLWNNINGPFILSLFLGVITGIIFVSKVLIYLFENHLISISAFIFGIIFATFIQFVRLIKNKKFIDYIYLTIALTMSTILTQLSGFNVEPSLVYLFFSSLVAVSAMILPGVSGAMIYLILGVYNEILFVIQNSIKVLINFNPQEFFKIYFKIFSITLGVIVGLKTFSKIVIWCFKNEKRKTLLILTGLIGGSLPKLWAPLNCINFDNLNNILTSKKSFILCNSNELSEIVFFILIGIILVLTFNRLKKPVEFS